MKLSKLALAVAAVAVSAPLAMADLVFPNMSYRTGPYAPNGIPFADGFADYITLLNERDGGVGGEKIRLLECETGYNTTKGVECYESIKADGGLFINPNSTGITYQIIPKARRMISRSTPLAMAGRLPQMATSSATSSTSQAPTGISRPSSQST